MDALIKVRDLRHSYKEGDGIKEVLHGINLDFMPGEIVIIMGPSGSGKSTLLKLIGAQLTIQGGEIEIHGQKLSGATQGKLRSIRRKVGFIFQSHHLLDSINVLQNVQLPLAFDERHTAQTSKKAAQEMLDIVGVGTQSHKKPLHLSGGQRQRVAIARALVRKPQIILADEPTASLDEKNGRDIVELIKKMSRELNVSVVLVTHDNRILDIADRIIKLVDGKYVGEERPNKQG